MNYRESVEFLEAQAAARHQNMLTSRAAKVRRLNVEHCVPLELRHVYRDTRECERGYMPWHFENF